MTGPLRVEVRSEGNVAAGAQRERCAERTWLLLGGAVTRNGDEANREEHRTREWFHASSPFAMPRFTPVNLFPT